MTEFNPENEKHFTVLTVKFVDPGCTLELQIEERDGRVTRLSTGEDAAADQAAFERALLAAFRRQNLSFTGLKRQ